ncbi:hypothetical protein Q4Q39_11910 [Flavivirga amylovorans]|uniref:Lipoprotein n=1 Tax=Flavivirga amylovorans TaxID=870486 RepID=A0ABT8X2D0_9FLAO|nr:hypothetical protein [Flavivirga amylovorans]MDO5988111.1 hypothetical protein [Flavivirga amylovorans]
MKNIIFFFVLLFCFLSCDDKEKYQGKWSNSYLKPSYYHNETKSIVIENDSIKFNYTYFDFWNKYSLKIEKGKFKFNNITIEALAEKDTLILNDSIYFIKNCYDTLYWHKPLLRINLPQIHNLTTPISISEEYLRSYIYYGKRLDNKEFSLQLNDRLAEMEELIPFIVPRCGGVGGMRNKPFPTNVLFIDKMTPMKYVEDIFYKLSLVNQLKISFVNNIDLKFSDSLGFYYNYQRLNKRISSNFVHSIYSPNSYKTYPPPPPSNHPLFNNSHLESNIIFLKKDKIYHNDKIINPSDLKTLIKPWIKNNDVLFSLYDLESTYGTFLKMNAIINSTYEEVREEHSKLKFNKPLKDLAREEINKVKMKIRMHHIWSYSIPHYNAVVKQENSFFGLKVNKKE